MKNILLIGVGRFGRHIAMHLNQLGHQVMAVDRNEERIDAVMPYVTNAQIGDSVNADFLRSLGVGNYDVCIVTIGSSFQDSLETACLLKELGAKENDVKLVGLSALMTTTLVSMKETIELLHENNLDCKVMVGGAVLTPEYAKEIHADFYAKDAKESVDIAKRVLG